MDTKETIKWLKIMRVNLKNFPEISNSKKIEALTNAIDIAEAFADPKKFKEMLKKDRIRQEKGITSNE